MRAYRDMIKKWMTADEAVDRYGMSRDAIERVAADAGAWRENYPRGQHYWIDIPKMDDYVDRLCLHTKYFPEYERIFDATKYDGEFCDGCLAQLKETFDSDLTDMERIVISNLYGIDCEKETAVQCAKGIGRSPERVRQIRNNALRKMRHALERWDKMSRLRAIDMELTTEQLLQMLKLWDTSLSNRAVSSLTRARMARSVYDLLDIDEDQLRKVRGCGASTIEEILQFQKCIRFLIGGEV